MDKLEYDVMYDFVESCFRQGYQDDKDNIDYFMRENDHMGISRSHVEHMYNEVLQDLHDLYDLHRQREKIYG